jgi:3-hydroxybutyryl-CoA dehydrogenase
MSEKPIIGVVGLGTMGLGIAQVYAQAGFHVLATDAFEATRDSAKSRLAETLAARVKARKLDEQARDQTLSLLQIVAGPKDMGQAQLVIEAIVEKLDAKRQLFAALEAVVDARAVLATNTSSLAVTAMAETLAHPTRLVGLHFFNPAPAMKLVELVAHAATDKASLDLARHLTETAGKTVIACADRPGFIVNRCARPFYGEALCLLEEGRSASDIDAAMLAAGYRIGPLSLIDLIGADVHLAATTGVYEGMGRNPRYHVFNALKAQVAKGDLGRKSLRGFIHPATPGPAPADADAIALRIEATLANEAASLLAEVSVDASGIDTAMKLGMNFPRGPFESAKARGPERIRQTLAGLEARVPAHLKGRYAASPALARLAEPA